MASWDHDDLKSDRQPLSTAKCSFMRERMRNCNDCRCNESPSDFYDDRESTPMVERSFTKPAAQGQLARSLYVLMPAGAPPVFVASYHDLRATYNAIVAEGVECRIFEVGRELVFQTSLVPVVNSKTRGK